MFKTEIKQEDIPVSLEEFRLKALAWADTFPLVAYYNPNSIPYPHDGFSHLLAVSKGDVLKLDEAHALLSLKKELQKSNNYYVVT
ncbi:hypothetical protein GCM10028895_06820 [Pontibacter rugosus]